MGAANPTNLIEAIRYFSDPDVCVEFVAKLRWPDGWHCPDCGGVEYSYLTTRRLWKCKACKRQTSVKVGTIFEDSAIPLDKWLAAIWVIANSKNGCSSHELGRTIGLTQKSAWFVLHRIRLAMQTGSFERFDGEVEVDETFVGGKKKNMHKHVAAQKFAANPTGGDPSTAKVVVAGTMKRGDGVRSSSKVVAQVLPDTRRATLHAHVRDTAEPGSTLYTDKFTSYIGLDEDYDHSRVDHAVEYVNGRVHTNGIENFWALLKRGLFGTYVSVSPMHLFRFIDERVFTFNTRDLTDFGRFALVLNNVAGRRLTWAELTSS
jgi:transposase-like protein